jgi:hypothetical protein
MKPNVVSFAAGLILGGFLVATFQKVQGETRPSTNEVTILEDFTPLPGDIVEGVSIQPQQNGHLVGNIIPRWMIPGRVPAPMIYGENQGATYFYFNLKTQKRVSDIFTPSNPPGPQIPPEILAKTLERVPLSCIDGTKKWAPRANGKCYPEDAPK